MHNQVFALYQVTDCPPMQKKMQLLNHIYDSCLQPYSNPVIFSVASLSFYSNADAPRDVA